MLSITRSDIGGPSELGTGVTFLLRLNEAIILIERLGFQPHFSDHGVHSWFGVAALERDNYRLERHFTLTVDRWGTAVVRTMTALERLFPRCLAALVEDHTADLIQIQVA